MPDWLWLRFLAIIAIFISCVPSFNYWHIIFSQKGFNKGTDLLSYTIFLSVFNISIYYTAVSNLQITEYDLSFIPFFACIHLLFFTILAAVLPLFYGLIRATNVVIKKLKFPTIAINNKILKTIVNCYISQNDINEFYFLTSEFTLLYSLLCYIISGIMTVSGIGNGLVITLSNVGFAINSTNSEATKKAETMLSIYTADLQLYKDLFLLAVIPLAIPQFVRAMKQK